ncbi:MAG: hypothetical protein AAFP68_19515 [Pseudomonadota bacterium]
MTHMASVQWLRVISWGLIVIGCYFSWATADPVNALSVMFVDLVFLPIDGAQTYAAQETRLLSAIAGGVTVGLGAAVLTVTNAVYLVDRERGRRVIMTFMLAWFIADGIGSALAGAPFNAVVNCLILLPVTYPVLAARPDPKSV